MGLKRSHTVKALFRRFALSLVVLLGVAILVPILLQTTAVNMGIATRANQSELQVREIVPTLTVAPDVTKVVLPQGCRYLILDKDFNELYSNMAADEKEDALLQKENISIKGASGNMSLLLGIMNCAFCNIL